MFVRDGRVAGSVFLAGLAAAATEPKVAAEAEPEADKPVEPAEPPRTGPGSSRDAWAAYARSQGVDVGDDMTRDDIVEALKEASDDDNDEHA